MHLSNENNPLLLKETAAQILLPIGDFRCQSRCELVCKLWYDLFKACSAYQVAKEDHFAAEIWPCIVNFPSSLIEALGGKKKVVQLPLVPNKSLMPYRLFGLELFAVFGLEELNGHAICRFEHYGRVGIAASYTLLHPDHFTSGFILLHQTPQNNTIRHGDMGATWLQRASEEDLAWFLSGKKLLLVDEHDNLLHWQLGVQEMPLKYKLNDFVKNVSTQISVAGNILSTALQIYSEDLKSSLQSLGN